MPVFKYRTLEQARRALWTNSPDHVYLEQLHDLWILADRLCPFKYPPGVYKYKNIEDANDARRETVITTARRAVETSKALRRAETECE